MPFIQLTTMEKTLSHDEKQELIKRITDAVVAVEGEDLRGSVWVVINDSIPEQQFGIGGRTLTADAYKAIRAARKSS
jgi:4-oxalocrotonate tautomerase